MTWVSVSLRKMTLKNRINTLEDQLMNISQQIQSSQQEGAMSIMKNNYGEQAQLSGINNDFKSSISGLDKDSDTYQTDILGAYTEWADAKMANTSIFDAQEEMIRSEASTKTSALEQQQEMLEAQLKSARSEYDALGEALDKDIEQSTIKLA
jgi:BMFP domain-containing protein YqiC